MNEGTTDEGKDDAVASSCTCGTLLKEIRNLETMKEKILQVESLIRFMHSVNATIACTKTKKRWSSISTRGFVCRVCFEWLEGHISREGSDAERSRWLDQFIGKIDSLQVEKDDTSVPDRGSNTEAVWKKALNTNLDKSAKQLLKLLAEDSQGQETSDPHLLLHHWGILQELRKRNFKPSKDMEPFLLPVLVNFAVGLFPLSTAQEMLALYEEADLEKIPVEPLNGTQATAVISKHDLVKKFDVDLANKFDVNIARNTKQAAETLFSKHFFCLSRFNERGSDRVKVHLIHPMKGPCVLSVKQYVTWFVSLVEVLLAPCPP